jgi:hypothetical protein
MIVQFAEKVVCGSVESKASQKADDDDVAIAAVLGACRCEAYELSFVAIERFLLL